MSERYSPRNLKPPTKPISSKERQARSQHSRALLNDQQRQAVEPSVMTMFASSPWPRQIHIDVPDHDDWVTFCAELLAAGQAQWYRQGDREARYNNHDPSVPRFETWAAFRKALLRVGERYWRPTGATRSRRGRPDMLNRCWRAMMKEFIAARAAGRLTYRKNDLVPLINGHPITQEEIQRMVRTGDHDPSPVAHNLSDKVCQKYSRLLYLAIKSKHQQLTPSDKAFQAKHLLPYFKTYHPELAKEPLSDLTQLFSVSTSLIALM
jgi:hypothetical protein